MNAFQSSLRKLETAFHLRRNESGSDPRLLLEIVMAKKLEMENLDLGAASVWCVARVEGDRNGAAMSMQLVTHEKSKSSRLLGSLHFAWFFKESMWVPSRESKVRITLMCRRHASSSLGAFDMEEKVIGTATVSASQLLLGEARDIALSTGDEEHYHHEDQQHNQTTEVGSVTVRMYEAGAPMPVNRPSRRSSAMFASANADLAAAVSSSLGTVQVVVWQGKAINTSCPCYITLDIPDLRHPQVKESYPQRCRTASRPNPHNPIWDYIAEFNIYSLHGNLVVDLWEENVTRSIKLGQVLVPLSWLTDSLTPPELLVETSGEKLTVSGWFEVFPCSKHTRYNRGGQVYLPAIKGIPSSTGYGMTYPSTPIGFIKLDISLHLREPVVQSILRTPWSYKLEREEVDDEEEAGLSSILVTGYAMLRIFKLLKSPPFFTTALEILNWKANFALCVAVLYTVSYTALLAQPWQFPLMVVLIVIIVGKAAGTNRQRFSDVRAFTNVGKKQALGSAKGKEEAAADGKADADADAEAGTGAGAGAGAGEREDGGMNAEVGLDESLDAEYDKALADRQAAPPSGHEAVGNKPKKDREPTSITDQYKNMKLEALRMEKSVQSACSRLERYSNMLCWGDPILSGFTALIAVLVALVGAMLLLVLTPNQAAFFLCLSLFMPKEVQDFVLRSLTKRSRSLVSWLLKQDHKRVRSRNQENEDLKRLGAATGRAGMEKGVVAEELEEDEGEGEEDEGEEEGGVKSAVESQKKPGPVTKKTSYTHWIKLQARRWLRMVPDDFDLFHGHIAIAAFVTTEQEFYRLPTKTKVYSLEGPENSVVGSAGGAGLGGGGLDESALFYELWTQATVTDPKLYRPTSRSRGVNPARLQEDCAEAERLLLDAGIFDVAEEDERQEKVPQQSEPEPSVQAESESSEQRTVTRRLELPAPKSIGDVYRERRRSQYLLLEKHITAQQQHQQLTKELQQTPLQQQQQQESESAGPQTSWSSTRHALDYFAKTKLVTFGGAGAGGDNSKVKDATTSVKPVRTRLEFKKSFTLRVTVLAAKGLQVKSSQNKVHGYMAMVAQKIYADLSVMPHSSCGVYCRTGGQPRAPNVVFREEFIFKSIDYTASALLVVLSMKSAVDSKGAGVHLGHAIAPLEHVQFELSFGQARLVEWFPIFDRSGVKISRAGVQLSLELVVT